MAFTEREYVLKTGEKLVVRPALPEDATDIMRLCTGVIAEGYYHLTTLGEFFAAGETGRVSGQQAPGQPEKVMLVAEVQDTVFLKLVGVIIFVTANRKRLAHHGTFGISVHKSWRSRGVGRALIKSLLIWAEESPGVEKVCLEVLASNTAAIALYTQMGFQEEGRQVRHVKLGEDSYVDLVLMYKFVKTGI